MRAAFLFSFLASPSAFAQSDAMEAWPLLPVPELLRPAPAKEASGSVRVLGRCEVPALPSMEERPFGPGEVLTYEVAVLGLRTGRVTMRVGEAVKIDNERAYPIFAQAETTGVLSVLGTLNGRMVSWMEPSGVTPVRMVNRFFFRSGIAGREVMVREDAAFSRQGEVAGRLTYQDGAKERILPARQRASTDLLDVLTVIFYARSRKLVEGAPLCFEIYHRRHLWRAEGTVGRIELVQPPFGVRLARRIDAKLRRLGGKGSEPREIVAWVSNDENRLPLLVQTPDFVGTLEVRLTQHIPGRRLFRRAQPQGWERELKK